MGLMSENILLMENRAYMYRLLGRIYKEEIDATFYEQLSQMRFFTECEDQELAEGYKLFEAFFQKQHLDPLTDLAVDYARVFLGAGTLENTEAAYPYESVYTSTEHLVMQEARDKVLAMYRHFGLDRDENLNMPEDQLGLELEFMAYLCNECKQALHEEDYSKAAKFIDTQTTFLKEHLLNWVPSFCNDVARCASSDFYLAIAKMTNGYLTLDQEILHYLTTTILISGRKAEAHAEYIAQEAVSSDTLS